MNRGRQAFEKLLAEYEFSTVLDIGSGGGQHAAAFRAAGKTVMTVSLGGGADFVGRYEDTQLPHKFDCLWCCHVLEHQPNVNQFLRKMHDDLKPGGILAITVPPLKHSIVGGHLTLWNAGLLLYNLAAAGFNCRDARVKSAGYDVSVIVRHESFAVPRMRCDAGDIDTLAPYLPRGCGERFDGRIEELNW